MMAISFCAAGRPGTFPVWEYHGQAKRDEQFAVYRRDGTHSGNGSLNGVHQNNGDGKPAAIDWQARAAEYARNFTPGRRQELAAALGLPEDVLDGQGIGFLESGPHRDDSTRSHLGPCWTFPERNGAGAIVGVSCRYKDGQKKAMAGGQRGLFVPAGWDKRHGPVFLPEGPSDALALTAINLPAIGRPNNAGGASHLAELLKAQSKESMAGPGRRLFVCRGPGSEA